MKAQTQAVSFVLITGITLSAITSAYIWGIPLIEKTQSQERINTVENDMIRLTNAAESMASSGVGGSTSVELRLGDGNVSVNEDSISVRLDSSGGSPYPKGQSILIYGDSFTGTSFGNNPNERVSISRNSPIVLGAKATGEESSEFRLETRELYDSNKDITQVIELKPGSSDVGAGNVEIQIENVGTDETSDKEKVVLEVDII